MKNESSSESFTECNADSVSVLNGCKLTLLSIGLSDA